MNQSYIAQFGNHYTRTYSMEINGTSRQLTLEYRYVPLLDYWLMTILDAPTGELVVANIPLRCNREEEQNLLNQLAYLGVGACYVYKAVDTPGTLWPTGQSFGVEYKLAWGDSLE